MTIEEAISVIRAIDSSFERRVEAAAVLADSSETPLSYLVECLNRKGLPAEFAAMKLYKRTGRPGPTSPRDFIFEQEDWKNYLEQNGFSAGKGPLPL